MGKQVRSEQSLYQCHSKWYYHVFELKLKVKNQEYKTFKGALITRAHNLCKIWPLWR